MIIRAAAVADAADIAKIHVLAWRSAYRGIMPDEFLDSLSVEQKTANWRRALQGSGPGRNDVLLQDGAVAGFMVSGPARDEDLKLQSVIELVALNIAPEHWRKGFGAALTRTLVEAAKQDGIDQLVLWTATGNNRAITFYEQFGFEADGVKRVDSNHCNAPITEARYRIGRSAQATQKQLL